MSEQKPFIPTQGKLPIIALVDGVFRIILRNPMLFVRAGLFPFILLFIISLWTTPQDWDSASFYAVRTIEWLFLIALWTFFTSQLQRFVLKGPLDGSASFLPKLNKTEAKFAFASMLILLPFSAFAFWYDQPLFLHQPDLLIMGSMTAMNGIGDLLYTGLFAGWIVQIFAYVLPAIAQGDTRSILKLCSLSIEALRLDSSRLFAASLLVVLPVWLASTFLRILLHTSFITQMALSSDANALAWNLTLTLLETLNVFLSGGLLAMLWALAYGRWNNIESFKNDTCS